MNNNRPYFNSSTSELLEVFRTAATDLEKLKVLKFELQNRRKSKAKVLEAEVDEAIRNVMEGALASIIAEDEASSNKPVEAIKVIANKITISTLVEDKSLSQKPYDACGVVSNGTALSAINGYEMFSEFPLYAWQRNALISWYECGCKGVIQAVTGAGKTYAAFPAIIDHLKLGWKIVVVVPSTALQNQWHKKITEIIKNSRKNPYCICRMGGKEEKKDRISIALNEFDIVIAVVHSAISRKLLPTGQRGLLIADECHHYGGEQWSKVLQPEFEKRLGLTATYERSDTGKEDFLEPYFENTCYKLKYEEALDQDVIAHFKIAFVGVEFSPKEMNAYIESDRSCKKLKTSLISKYGVSREPFGTFFKEVSALSKDDKNDIQKIITARSFIKNFNKRREIMADAKQKIEGLLGILPSIKEADRTILFSQTKETAEHAVDVLVQNAMKASVIDSTMKMKDREAILVSFEKGDDDIIAAPKLLDEGVDVPAADLAIILASSRSERQMVQRMGRVLRKKDDERLARVVIFYVKETTEDPKMGAHETFIELIEDVATAKVFFDVKETKNICNFLNDFRGHSFP